MNTMQILVSGSIAYDTIMVFDGHFGEHILPDRVHALNVAFLVPAMKRELGGTAANIAFNLAGLDTHATPLATVGHDGEACLRALSGAGVDLRAVRRLETHFTAQAFITTDLGANQITAFHPGAMDEAAQVTLAHAHAGGAALGIVSPNAKAAMQAHARQFAAAGIPFVFDPGQAMPLFDGEELRELVTLAQAVAVNDYECELLVQRTGWSETALADRVEALLVTRGAEGAEIFTGGQRVRVPAAPVSRVVDPTGCGDAWRGGLLAARARGFGWLDAARVGSVMGAIKVEHAGAQNHAPDVATLRARHEAAFGPLVWAPLPH